MNKGKVICGMHNNVINYERINKKKKLNSQNIREAGPEVDPLWLGSGWSLEDLSKPQIILESTFGDNHPGSKHLNQLVEQAKIGVYNRGGKPSAYTVTDICDGVATGHDGMNYSLVSRDIISAMTEIHVRASGADAIITFSSCDKSIPAHLMALARLKIPSIQFCGGSMMPGPDFISPEKCYETAELVKKGIMNQEEQLFFQTNACPTYGACQYMGTASSMQVIAEALGMSLPGNALIPAESNLIRQLANSAGKYIMSLLDKQITPKEILTKKAFENAIMVHAAISGSTNILIHLPAIAKEAGIDIRPEDFDYYNKKIPVLSSIKTTGTWPTQIFWYAGGVPGIMLNLKDYLHLDAMTITGKTIGENLENLKKEGFFRKTSLYLKNFGVKSKDVIKSLDHPYNSSGGLAILKGNLAPNGAVVKHSAVVPEMHRHVGPAKPFNSEEDAIKAITERHISPGDVIIIRYEGPKGAGMPEMLKTTEAIFNRPDLVSTTALITDGRFSGATRGPAIGHVSPEAAVDGPIALVEEGDIIKIDIPNRRIDIIGTSFKEQTVEHIEMVLQKRKKILISPLNPKKGILKIFEKLAGPPMDGGSIF